MSRNRKKDADAESNGTHESQTAVAEAPASTEAGVEPPVSQAPLFNEPTETFSYPGSRDTWVQALIFERLITLKDNTTFKTHEVSVRKLWMTPQGDWKPLYLFRGSELYALAHAVERAERWILDSRANDTPL